MTPCEIRRRLEDTAASCLELSTLLLTKNKLDSSLIVYCCGVAHCGIRYDSTLFFLICSSTSPALLELAAFHGGHALLSSTVMSCSYPLFIVCNFRE
jgi:hypothetical protein